MLEQLNFLEQIPEEEFLPCDKCGYDVIGCCNYPDTPEDYCVMGDKWIPKDIAAV